MSDKLAKELAKGDAQDPELVDFYTKSKDRYTSEYLTLRSAQSNANNSTSYSTYNNMFNNIFAEELAKVQPGGSSSWVTTPNGAGGVSINWVGQYSKEAYDAYSGARAKAAERFMAATDKLPAGPMKDVVNTLIENYEAVAKSEIDNGVMGGMTAAEYRESGFTAYTGPGMVVEPNTEYIISRKDKESGAVSSSLVLGSVLIEGGKAKATKVVAPIEVGDVRTSIRDPKKAVMTDRVVPVDDPYVREKPITRPGIMSNPTQQ